MNKEVRELLSEINALEQELEHWETCHSEEPGEQCWVDNIEECEGLIEEKQNTIRIIEWMIDNRI